MRWNQRLLVVVAVSALSLVGCDGGWWLGPLGRRPTPVRADEHWLALDVANVGVWEPDGGRQLHLTVALPAPRHAGSERRLTLRFAQPLDGAKVDVSGWSPTQAQTLLHSRRFPGDTIDVPLGRAALHEIRVVIHRHLRQPPILRDVRVGESSAGPPPSTSPRQRPAPVSASAT